MIGYKLGYCLPACSEKQEKQSYKLHGYSGAKLSLFYDLKSH